MVIADRFSGHGKVGRPIYFREEDQEGNAEADFRNNDRQRHRALDQPFEREAEAPEHDRRQRADYQTHDCRQKCDGQRIDHRLYQTIVVQRLFIIFEREAFPLDIAPAVIEAENHQHQKRRIEEQHGQPDPAAHPQFAGIFERGDGGAIEHQRTSFTLLALIDCSAIRMNIA